MKRTRKIAIQGIDIDASPVEVATQGLIILVEPQPALDAGSVFAWRSYELQPERRDCKIEVRGCKAKFSTGYAEAVQTDVEDVDETEFEELVAQAVDARLWQMAEEQAERRFDKAQIIRSKRKAEARLTYLAEELQSEITADPMAVSRALALLIQEVDQLKKEVFKKKPTKQRK